MAVKRVPKKSTHLVERQFTCNAYLGYSPVVSAMLTSGFLKSLRLKAIRRRVYYRVLGRLDRGILELSTRVVDQVRSVVLLQQLFEIVVTLEEALKSRFTKHLESFGFKRVVQMVKQAVRFGYRDASEWIMDYSFAVYLTVQNINQPRGYRVEVS